MNLAVACGNNPDPLRPFKGLDTISKLENQANSNYNSLQVSLRRTLGRLNFSLAYTYSHSIDNSSDRFDSSFVDSYNLRSTRASSNFDQKHLLNVSYVYDLPLFQTTGLMRSILGGWQISGITSFQTGTPFDVYNAVSPDNAGVANGVGAGSFVDVIGNPYSKPPVTEVAGIPGPLLFNPNAFAAPRGLTFGNAGRNFLRNPSRTNWDVGLFKHFAIKEQRALEFRAEVFNVFNHTQWSGINSTATCYAGEVPLLVGRTSDSLSADSPLHVGIEIRIVAGQVVAHPMRPQLGLCRDAVQGRMASTSTRSARWHPPCARFHYRSGRPPAPRSSARETHRQPAKLRDCPGLQADIIALDGDPLEEVFTRQTGR